MNPEILKERVQDRARRLYEDGYRAAAVRTGTDAFYIIITPGGDDYSVDTLGETCTCHYFPSNGYCKHQLGLKALLAAQARAKKAQRVFRKNAGAAQPPAQPVQPAPTKPAAKPRPSAAEAAARAQSAAHNARLERDMERDFYAMETRIIVGKVDAYGHARTWKIVAEETYVIAEVTRKAQAQKLQQLLKLSNLTAKVENGELQILPKQ